METNSKAYMYKEGNLYWVVYGDFEGLFGPDEKCFSSKKEAEEFLKKCNEN